MWKKLFGSDEKKEEPEDNSLESKIDQAVKKCQNDKKEAENKINQLKGWATDAIIDIYADFFPNGHLSFYRDKYKKDTLEKYEQIKTEHGSKLGLDMVKKCDQIVSGYLNHIKLLESKMHLFDKLFNQHNATKQKLNSYKEKSAKMDKLSTHTDRLNNMNEDVSGLANAYSADFELESINNEFALKEEYFKQMDILSKQYGENDKSFDNSLAYKDEIDNIINKL